MIEIILWTLAIIVALVAVTKIWDGPSPLDASVELGPPLEDAGHDYLQIGGCAAIPIHGHSDDGNYIEMKAPIPKLLQRMKLENRLRHNICSKYRLCVGGKAVTGITEVVGLDYYFSAGHELETLRIQIANPSGEFARSRGFGVFAPAS